MRRSTKKRQPLLHGFSTAESRWARLGAYYAMFPVDFVERVVRKMSKKGATIVDPFCGRGTAPYVAMITGRQSVGCEINPVVWLYAIAKTDPHPSKTDVVNRLSEIQEAITVSDAEPQNEFQSLAFGKKALAFINAARRELKWRTDSTDRSVAAIMILFCMLNSGKDCPINCDTPARYRLSIPFAGGGVAAWKRRLT